MSLIRGARWIDAREAARGLCRQHVDDPEAWFLLGAIHGQLGEWGEAEAASDHAAKLSPGVATAHFNLGVARLRQCKPGAAASLRTAVNLQPDNSHARSLLKEASFAEGRMLAGAGDTDAAIRCLMAALPEAECLEIRLLLGEICFGARRRDEAVMHYRRACDLDSGSAVAHACLADTMLAGDPGRPERLEALHHLRTAVRLDPGFIVARVNLAAALTMLGFHTEAVTEYTRVLELSPGNPAAILGVVRTYEAAGQIAEAEAALRPWLDMASSTPEIALAYGIMGSHMKARTPAIEAMKAVIIQGRCDPEIEKAACFRIGDLLDKEGEYSSAFSYYERGNALHPVVYDPKGQTQRISILTDFFSAERIAKLPRATNRSRLPVFIVGMPRSGTTLVETILASHPLVHGAGELDDLFLMRPEIARASRSGKQYPECLETIPVEALNRFGAKHLESLAARDRDATRVTDKLPQNFLLLGLIDLLFPGARVIHCMRDPLDTCLSIYCQPFQQHHTYADNLTNIGHYYREYIRLMAHWRTVLRIPLLDLHYEDLVINPEENTRLLLDFCELKWDERCLRHHESGRVTNTFSYNQVRQPIYRKSVARWRGYEKHLGPLIEALGDACDPTSGAT